MPAALAIGTRSGVSTSTAEPGSMKQPTISRNRLMIMSSVTGETCCWDMKATMAWGTPLMVSSHENTPDAATLIMIWAVRKALLTVSSNSRRQVRVR